VKLNLKTGTSKKKEYYDNNNENRQLLIKSVDFFGIYQYPYHNIIIYPLKPIKNISYSFVKTKTLQLLDLQTLIDLGGSLFCRSLIREAFCAMPDSSIHLLFH